MLADVQTALLSHFTALARERSMHNFPVYGLEHGLEPATIDALQQALARFGRLDDAHWLVWIAVASEIGYAYDGDEYWRSFEETIPNWRLFGDRKKVRQWFTQFAVRFSGFRPVGRWAEHFSIIAWPITHAILPRDLQVQFARLIFDLRYQLAARSNASLEGVGSILENGSASIGSRFQNFLDQRELTACLVLALRDEDVQGTVSSISRPTLARIVADLERRHSARDWLRDTRKVLRDARFRTNGTLGSGSHDVPAPVAANEAPLEGIRLIARQSTEGDWHVGVILPNFRELIARMGVQARQLDQTRVQVIENDERWIPGRALLARSSSEQAIPSMAVVAARQSLFKLERDVGGLAGIIEPLMRVRGSSPWLLRIYDDGVARQIFGNHVRAGESYIIISSQPLATPLITDLRLAAASSTIADAHIYLLTVPANLDGTALKALDALHLGYALRANVEFVGLVPRWRGASEITTWLTTEEPVLRLSCDHPIREFIVVVDTTVTLRIPLGGRSSALVSLGHLALGRHTIEIRAARDNAQGDALEPVSMAIAIEAPQPWIEGVREKSGFRVQLDPPDASLDMLLSHKARADLIGPQDRPIKIDMRLFDVNGHPVEQSPLGVVTSLSHTAEIARILSSLTKEPRAEKVQAAPRVQLIFSMDELGIDSLTFDKKVSALRWSIRRRGQDSYVRLIDEAGGDNPVTVSLYPILAPDQAVEADATGYLTETILEAPGALISAMCNEKRYSAIVSVPPRGTLTSLSDLGVAPTVSGSRDAPRDIHYLISILRLWSQATQVLGPLSSIRRADVCEEIERRIETILCGSSWMERVRRLSNPTDTSAQYLRNNIGGSPGYTSRITTTNWLETDDLPRHCGEFTRIANVYRICDEPRLCELAFTVAFAPAKTRKLSPKPAVADWQRLVDTSALVRGAYLASHLSKLRRRVPAPSEGR